MNELLQVMRHWKLQAYPADGSLTSTYLRAHYILRMVDNGPLMSVRCILPVYTAWRWRVDQSVGTWW